MTTTPKVIIPSKLAETAATLQYQSSDCKTSIDKFTAYNGSSLNALFAVYLVAAGGTPGPSNVIVKTIPPMTTWPFPEVVGHSMDMGDEIWTLCSVADAVSLRSSARQFT